MSADEERLRELEGRAVTLTERREKLNRQADRRREERDRLNESVKSIRSLALEEKEQRDELNRRVAEIKERVQGLRRELDEKRERLAQTSEEEQGGRGGLPPRHVLERDLRRIEWELSTTPTVEMKEREAQLVERARELKEALDEHERLQAQEEQRFHSLADAKAVEVEIRRGRDEMREFHDQSQEHHERMIHLHRRADEEGERADEAHAGFLESVAAVREVNAKLDVVMGETREIRGELRKADRAGATKRRKEIEARKRELKEDVQRRLENGEKLSLEELKLLYDDEEEEEAEPSR
jgi:uncharacterized coiled-coil DUF342 family protein